MITRKNLIEAWRDAINNGSFDTAVNSMMDLIVDERNQYQELVDAAVMWHKFMDHNDRNHEMTAGIPKGLADAVKPFIKLSLSEKITMLTTTLPSTGEVEGTWVPKADLVKLAEEAKTLEQERELMKYT